MQASIIKWLLSFFSLFGFVTTKSNSSLLNGRHIIIGTLPFPVSLYVIRNSSGYIVGTDGITSVTLSWLSQRLGFKYSFLQVNDTKMEPLSAELPGFTYYLVNGKCDLITGSVATIIERYIYMDFVTGFLFAPLVSLIPRPESLNNIGAITKPFQISVWIVLLVVIVAVIIAIYFINNKLSSKKLMNKYHKSASPLQVPAIRKLRPLSSLFTPTNASIFDVSTYVLGVLLNQGNYLRIQEKFFATRILLSAWCLASFVIITAYTSLLISYILSPPHAQPLIESMNDMLKKPEIFPVVDKGTGIDVLLMNAANGPYKILGDRLRANSESRRCTNSRSCVELVKLGSHVYINPMFAAMKVMRDDYDASKTCNLVLAKKNEYSMPASWAFPKKSLYKENFAQGLAEIFDFGLVNIWTQWYQPDVRQCRNEYRKSPKSDKNRAKLSLKNMTGAFVVLLVGIVTSFLILLGEMIFFFH